MGLRRAAATVLLSALAVFAFAIGAAHSQQPERPLAAGKWVVVEPLVGHDPELRRLVIDDTAPRAKWWVLDGPKTCPACNRSERNCRLLVDGMKKYSLHAAIDDPNERNLMSQRQDDLARCERSDGSDLFRPNRDPYPPVP
jgi:hypothetical protein